MKENMVPAIMKCTGQREKLLNRGSAESCVTTAERGLGPLTRSG